MKITVEVLPESQHQRCVEAPMSEAKLREVSRTITGGHMSSVMLVITYEGAADHYDLFKDSIYVVVQPENKTYNKIYYSLKALEGYYGESLDDFKNYLKNKSIKQIEIKHF